MIIFAYSLSVLAMLLVPILLAVLLRRKYQVPWLLFAAGSLTFIGSQIVHFPLNDLLTKIGLLPQSGEVSTFPLWQMALVLGLTAGLCEELARAAGYWLLKRYRRFEDGVMLGLGHGGIESMVFGGVLTAATLSSLIPLRGTDLSSLNLSTEQLAALTQQMQAFEQSALWALAPLGERLIAISIHVVLSLIVLRAFTHRNAAYVVLAIAYHAAIDALVVFLAYRFENPWITLGGLLASILPGIIWLWRTWPKRAAGEERKVPTIRREVQVFLAACQKELLQQWRTKRVIIVLAVFGLFGLMSPLLAYFMPQIFSSIEGAEMFAHLIPTPTVKDAMDQYIKNITQFGFILAIFFGMGAVAGEKERGITAMILSKPMPRWAFVTSKFVAQSIVYLAGFLLATLFAYIYTIILFGPISFLDFLAVNALLLLWLLTFVAVALLGSVIGSTTPSAAGIGLAGAVVLMLAANLPKVGALAPSGLVGWASQIAVGGEQTMINGGAAAMGLVIIVMSLVASVAFFERQEL